MQKKLDKQFILSDSSQNAYGYKLRTEGCLLGEFAKNPIGYYNHKNQDEGVLVRWEDLAIVGGNIVGTPVINLSHPRGERTVQEIEDGFLNAASVGQLVFLRSEMEETDSEPILVVTQWYFRECSLVNLPANESALAIEPEMELAIELSDKTTMPITRYIRDTKQRFNSTNNMKKINLTPALLELLDLSADDASAEGIEEVISTRVSEMKTSNTELKKENSKLQTELSLTQEGITKKEVSALLDKALDEGKITKATSDKLSVSYAKMPTELSELLSTMPRYKSVSESIEDKNKGLAALATELSAMDWDVIDKSGRLAELKSNFPDIYKEKYKKTFGKEPKM